ncbi:MAG: hypothetical protein V7646_7869 [Pseudonocardia sp.]|jgi:hypothetical protein
MDHAPDDTEADTLVALRHHGDVEAEAGLLGLA